MQTDIASLSGGGYVHDTSLLTVAGMHLMKRAASNVAPLTIDTANLTGTGTNETARDGGVAAQNELQRVYHDGTGGTFKLALDGEPTAALNWDSNAAAVDAGLEATSTVNLVNVTGSGTAADPWFVEFVGTHAGTDVSQLTGDHSLLTGGIVGSAPVLQPGIDADVAFLSITHTAAGSGPNLWNAADNWSLGRVPDTHDVVYLAEGDIDILFGLIQSSDAVPTLNAAAWSVDSDHGFRRRATGPPGDDRHAAGHGRRRARGRHRLLDRVGRPDNPATRRHARRGRPWSSPMSARERTPSKSSSNHS